MTSKKHQIFYMTFTIIFFILISGCGSEESRWEKAKKTDTTEAYQSFLSKYPNSQYSPNAKARVEELELSYVKTKNTPEGYREYALKHPFSKGVIRAVGQFTGHSIMVGDDGSLLTGMFGSAPPGFEIRSDSLPNFVYKMNVSDADEAGFIKNGTLELAATYTYTNGEMIVLVTLQGDAEVHTLVYFKCEKSAFVKDDGHVISSKATPLGVALLN